MRSSCHQPENGTSCLLKASGQMRADPAMPQKAQKSAQTAHYIELGGYQYWPVLVPRGIRLYTYEQIPVFLRENPYITDGYRAYLPSRLCIKSLFILSNETVNIWSHLLGFLLFFCLGVYNMAAVLPAVGASGEDYVIYSIGLFCFQLCMLCSVGFHLFCCHRSEKTSRRWMALDYAGVSIGILGCYVPGVFYTFYCHNYWRQVYLVTVLAMILAIFFTQIHPHYLSKQRKQLRSLIFCSVAGYGLVPTVHWICITGGFSSQLVQAFIPRVLGMYFIAALALIFYVSKVPERYFPGENNTQRRTSLENISYNNSQTNAEKRLESRSHLNVQFGLFSLGKAVLLLFLPLLQVS
ncbi:progestin and adipoQ receptor family member 3a isoform X1 [Embiotoca jacksoni]|uniref:progestin and adipoQ receptor family member 3a isoform X1 n=2 Tax=Embiotoca jacksoni TaxID=100190 RepID=UPI0037043A02